MNHLYRGVMPRIFDTIHVHNSHVYITVAGLKTLPPKVKQYVEDSAKMCQPKDIHVCDGSDKENQMLIDKLIKDGMLKKVPKLENCYLARTDPRDVARVETKTVISTNKQEDTVPTPKKGVKGELGIWMSPQELQKACDLRFPKSMSGRTMYVIPYSMGPVGSPLSKIGIEITDSPYVVASMRIMTRIGGNVLNVLDNNDFVRCLHSVGRPWPIEDKLINNWPCNPDQTLISHIPDRMEIRSFGSGYGGNSLLGKKCFALRLGSVIARNEGWLAEHMLILGVTNPKGVKRYIAAAFPSACGKTNLAMLTPTIPGYKVECVGDDIAWMRFDKETGELRAINPEAGFFGVAPGTSAKTNPIALDVTKKNTIFTNVAETSDGNVWWEGMTDKPPAGVKITDWLGKEWTAASKNPAAHPNSRFCSPAKQCKIIDPKWEDPTGVPISAILFGGRRPHGIPLVYEAFDWKHGVFVGACMKSEVTAAAQDVKKEIRHDPFAMKPFFGYNFGKYVEHWLSMEKPGRKMPRIYHVNWFRKHSQTGSFLWPGFGENSRVIDWILRRIDGEDCAVKSPIGNLPKPGSIRVDGLQEKVDFPELFRLPKDFWVAEADAIEKYMRNQAENDLPAAFWEQVEGLKKRIATQL